MSTWLDLYFRELLLLTALGVVGSGPVAVLARSVSPMSRIALAPAAGLALAGAVLTTAHLEVPMSTAAWAILLPLCVLSVAVAIVAFRRTAPERRGVPSRVEVLQLAVVVLVTLAALNHPLAARDSLGPMGYSVFDGNSYVGFTEAARHHTLQVDISHLQTNPDLTFRDWAFYSKSFVLVRTGNFVAAMEEITGWRSSDTEASFMAVLLLIGGLGTFALVRELSGTRSWFAVLGGLLFVGPLFFQLYIDGSEGLISGLALMPGATLALVLFTRRADWRAILLLGLFAAGLDTMHPVFMVLLVIWALTYVAALVGAAIWRRRRIEVRPLVMILLPIVAVGVLAAALSPVATVFNLRFYDWARGNFYTQGLPVYALPLKALPAWLLQTREFFFLPPGVVNLNGSLLTISLSGLLLNVLAPLALVLAALYGIWRYRTAWILAALIPAMAVFGLIANGRNCSYCVQRDLIPLGPVLVAMVALGLVALSKAGPWRLRAAAVVLGLAVVVLSGHKSLVLAKRVKQGGYAVPAEAREVLRKLPRHGGPVYVEAFGQGRNGPAPMEMTALYNLVNEATDARVAVSLETNDYGGLAYLAGVLPQHSVEYTPRYRWVVTRVGGIRTARRVVSRAGPFALEERAHPFDASVISGVAVDEVDRDRQGMAWVQGPMRFWIAADADAAAKPSSLRLDFAASKPVSVVEPRRSKVLSRTPAGVSVCIPVKDRGELRRLTVTLRFAQAAEEPPPDVFGLPSPAKAVRLAGMRAVTGGC